MHISWLKVQQLLPLANRVLYLQTKPNEQIIPLIFSDKDKEYCICHKWPEPFIIE